MWAWMNGIGFIVVGSSCWRVSLFIAGTYVLQPSEIFLMNCCSFGNSDSPCCYILPVDGTDVARFEVDPPVILVAFLPTSGGSLSNQ